MKINSADTYAQDLCAAYRVKNEYLRDCYATKPNQAELQRNKKRRIIESLIAQRNNINDGLSVSNVDSFLAYSKNNCEIEPTKIIRKALFAKKKVKSSMLNESVLYFDYIISKSKLPEDVSLYRCCTPFDFGLPMSSKDFLDEFYEKDKYFRIPVHVRTTLRKKFAKYYVREIIKKMKQKPIIYKINAYKGAKGIYADEIPAIKPNIAAQMEEEVILPRNSIFQFKNRVSKTNYELVELNLVPRWKVPFFKKIHNFRQESNIPPFSVKKDVKTKSFV